jgi:AAA15 family ATPase/GTPase
MIKKIGVKNFRVFKDYAEFEIRPITILTGLNNSEKCFFSELLLVLKTE